MRYFINRYGHEDKGILVADRDSLELAEQVAAIFQKASNNKGENYTYKAETFKGTSYPGLDV